LRWSRGSLRTTRRPALELLSPRAQLGIAAAMQDVTRFVGEHDYIPGFDDLLEKDIHHRLGMNQQVMVSFYLVGEIDCFFWTED
jgi:hypothetical protein